MSIHRVERRLETALRNLDAVDITKQNKEDIRAFLNFISSHKCGISRQCKYIYPLQNLAKWLKKDYMKATKADIEVIVQKVMESKDYTAWTKQDYMVVIKKFYKWLYNRTIEDEDEWEIPKLVKFIKINKPKEAKTIPSDLLTPKEVRMLSDCAKNLREKALILSLYETGARIHLKGKTGYRWVRVVGSAPALSEWIAHDHPKKNDKNSSLFCVTRPNCMAGTEMSYSMVRKLLKELQARSGINKNLRPHLWRHARATELAEHLSDAVRCEYFGWVQGSDMSKIYTHLADTDNIILEMNGLVEKTKDRNGQFNQVICPRCETKNPYGTVICSKCMMTLDSKSIEEFFERKTQATHPFAVSPEMESSLDLLIEKMVKDKLEEAMKNKK